MLQVLLQAGDRVAQWPGARLVGRTVLGGVVAGRVALGAIGHQFDQGGAKVGSSPFRRPLGAGKDRKKVVAVYSKGRNAITDPPSRECSRLAVGDTLEGGDRPLVIDNIEDDGSSVDLRQGQSIMEVTLGRGSFADPRGRDRLCSLIGLSHGPADRLAELGAEVAGY